MSFALSGKNPSRNYKENFSAHEHSNYSREVLSHRNGGLQVGDKAIFEEKHHKRIYSLEI